MISKLDVICSPDLYHGVIRRRWERALPLEFEHVQLLEGNKDASVDAPLLIGSESYPSQIQNPRSKIENRKFLYLPAGEVQAHWIYHRKPPPFSLQRKT